MTTATRALEEIPTFVETTYHEVEQATGTAFNHMIEIGHALLEAERMVGGKGFVRWHTENIMLFTYKTGQRYMRVATHEEVVRAEGIASLNSAERFLTKKGLNRKGSKYAPGVKQRVLELHAQGLKAPSIAAEVVVPESTVYNWIGGPAQEARRARSLAYNRRLQEQRNELQRAAVERAGEGVTAAYDLIALLRTMADGLTADASPIVRRAAIPLVYAAAKAMNTIANECARETNVENA